MASKDEAREALIEHEHEHEYQHQNRYLPRHRSQRLALAISWTLTALFFCTTCVLGLKLRRLERASSYENGFTTDFVSHNPDIPIKVVQKHFTNDLLYNASSESLYIQPLDPNEVSYVGEPSAAIDKAWKDLLHAQYVGLEQDEMDQIPAGHIGPFYWAGEEHNYMELAVFHNLHCLNEVRLALEGQEHNHRRDGINVGRWHLDHCVDQIRQALMCHADLTPVPMKELEEMPGTLIGNGEIHTCRDFDTIWAWVEERGRRIIPLGE